MRIRPIRYPYENNWVCNILCFHMRSAYVCTLHTKTYVCKGYVTCIRMSMVCALHTKTYYATVCNLHTYEYGMHIAYESIRMSLYVTCIRMNMVCTLHTKTYVCHSK